MPRVKWAEELESNKVGLGSFYRIKVIMRRYIVKEESNLFI